MDYSQEAVITVKVSIQTYKLLTEAQIMELQPMVNRNQIMIEEIVSVQSVEDTATFIG
jgi:hypothetical protein